MRVILKIDFETGVKTRVNSIGSYVIHITHIIGLHTILKTLTLDRLDGQ